MPFKVYSLDFIPSNVTNEMSDEELYDFILDRVATDRVLMLENGLDPEKRLELIQKGLERFSEDFIGLKMVLIGIKTERQGIFRSKEVSNPIFLIAPGNAVVNQFPNGEISVKISDDEMLAGIA